jgi:uncharacterized protein (DUF697 family)
MKQRIFAAAIAAAALAICPLAFALASRLARNVADV